MTGLGPDMSALNLLSQANLNFVLNKVMIYRREPSLVTSLDPKTFISPLLFHSILLVFNIL